MITRIIRKKNPFAMIDKRVLEDDRISWRAKGILAYLLSKPDDWTIRCEDILNHGTEGRDAVRSAMKELRDHGYAKLINTTNGREWHVYEEPVSGEESSPEKHPDPSTESRTNWKTPTTNNKEETNKELLSVPPEKRPRKGSVAKSKPSLNEVIAFAISIGLPQSDGEFCYHKWEGNGWKNGSARIRNWQATIRSWKTAGYLPSQRSISRPPQHSAPAPSVVKSADPKDRFKWDGKDAER